MSLVALTAVTFVSLCLPAMADTYVVDPQGGGDFRDLQRALDKVPDGSTLLLRGVQRTNPYDVNPYGLPFTITKSVELVGENDARIVGRSIYQGAGADALIIDAGAASTVIISNLSISAGVAESWGSNSPDGIRVESVGSLAIDRCWIEAGTNFLTDCSESHGDNRGGDGIEIRGPAGVVAITNSVVHGGEGIWTYGWAGGYCKAYTAHGGAGIDGTGADSLIVILCDVTGGDGGDCTWFDDGTGIGSLWNWGNRPFRCGGNNGGPGIIGDPTVIGGEISGGLAGEYDKEPWEHHQHGWGWGLDDHNTFLGESFFTPGVDGPAITDK